MIWMCLCSRIPSWRRCWASEIPGLTSGSISSAGSAAFPSWKEDAINGYFAKRKALPGTDFSDTVFHPDSFLVKTAAAESRWQYDKILALADTDGYVIFVMGKNHAMAMEKANLEGGSISEFCRFIEDKSGRKIQNI